MNRTRAHLLRIFVTGALAALPLAATILIFWWLLSLLLGWLGPGSPFGRALGAVGLGVTGSGVVSYLIGMGLVVLAIFLLGVLVEAGLQRGLARLVDTVLARIPLVGRVYDLSRKIVGLVSQRDPSGMLSMSTVWCHFGGVPAEGEAGGAVVLGLLSTREPVTIGGQPYVGVIVPTAPVPVGGGLLFLPQSWVRPAGVGIEALTSIYVSMGMTAPEHLRGTPGGPAAAGPVVTSGNN
jgi:uncharacterized membrane protein